MAADVAETQWVWSWREMGRLETNCSASDFLLGVEVWVKRPQVVNRRVLGALIVEEEGKKLKLEDTCEPPQRDGMITGVDEHVLIRELLPRVKGVAPRRETISTRRGDLHQPVAVKVLASLYV